MSTPDEIEQYIEFEEVVLEGLEWNLPHILELGFENDIKKAKAFIELLRSKDMIQRRMLFPKDVAARNTARINRLMNDIYSPRPS